MISLARQTMKTAVAGDGGNRTFRGWTRWRIGACAALFAGSALFGQQAPVSRQCSDGGSFSHSPVADTSAMRSIAACERTSVCYSVDRRAKSRAAERLRSLSALLPQVTGAVSENIEQIDLKTRGINFHLPGFSTPAVVGPFHYTDARAYASFSVFDYSLRKSYRAAKEGERAAQLSFKDARDLVVQSVANAYLLVIAGSSRVQALRRRWKPTRPSTTAPPTRNAPGRRRRSMCFALTSNYSRNNSN